MRRYFLFTRKPTAADAVENILLTVPHPDTSIIHNANITSAVKEKDLYEQLLEKGYSKQSIHKVLHHLVLADIKQQRLYEKKSFIQKARWHLTAFLNHASTFELLKHITAKGLFLLKTQFAKKPKNPV